jgi:hypothetical protein
MPPAALIPQTQTFQLGCICLLVRKTSVVGGHTLACPQDIRSTFQLGGICLLVRKIYVVDDTTSRTDTTHTHTHTHTVSWNGIHNRQGGCTCINAFACACIYNNAFACVCVCAYNRQGGCRCINSIQADAREHTHHLRPIMCCVILDVRPLTSSCRCRKTALNAQTHRHTDTQTHRHTDTQTHRHTDTQTPYVGELESITL